ncbi:ankyrin repeat domain-containing protein [Longimicrobium sp.]|uniref:ankyrin repeat domain-containing protein n=1 Tax=Longimicrobium sp. TaxID=2029185 RepID=UPI003B3A2919
MSELQTVVEQLYRLAKSGQWDHLISEWTESAVLANRCSRYAKPGSAWTFLHQAAHSGNERACRILISRGASVAALTHDSRSPAHVAEQRGHHDLAALLRQASAGTDPLWLPPADPDVLPSSSRWGEATEAVAQTVLFVAYAGSLVRISRGTRYFVDSFGRVLVGWHGTYNPPRGMDGYSMVSGES